MRRLNGCRIQSNLSSPSTKCLLLCKKQTNKQTPWVTNFHSFRLSTWAHFSCSTPTKCFLKMNYVSASKQNGHEVICAQCHGLSLTEQSSGWESDVGRFRRCCVACFGNGGCPDILTKIFIGLPASEDSFLDLCVREETQSFQSFINNKTPFNSKISQSSRGLPK